jgi:spore coat polysaccharide biosynthesis predicted glycosyltransferase SpsG
MKIVIVTDGNSTLGLGHIYQSLSLAAALQQRCGAELVLRFLTKSGDNVRSLIRNAGFDEAYCASDAEILATLQNDPPRCVIFDKLDVAPELAQAIKQTVPASLAIFTNLTAANDYADLAVLADMGSDFKNVRRIDPVTGAVKINGPRYWLLRPEFYGLSAKAPAVRAPVQQIMLMFGGADPANYSSLVLDRLLAMPAALSILLVLGSAFPHEAQLQAVLARHAGSRSQLRIRKNVSNVAQEMRAHDVVFASPGMSFFEALAVGTPVLGFHQNALQQQVYAAVFRTLGPDDLGQLPEIIQTQQFVNPADAVVAAMEIGRGKDEILDYILNHS